MLDFLFKKVEFKKQPRECISGFKIAGITKKNEDGSKRQDIVRTLKEGDKLILKVYDFNGRKAIGVYTEDNRQLGNIKEEDIVYVLDKMKTMTKCYIHDIDCFCDGFGKTIYYARVVICYMQK